MKKSKRITANLPADLLRDATQVTARGITDTIVYGLQLVKRTSAYEKAQKLKGKLNIDIDLDLSRERYTR